MVDQQDTVHHPRNTASVIGHEKVISAIAGNDRERRHHGFILSGPKGIGKATAAYRAAERLMTSSNMAGLFGENDDLRVDENDPDIRLIRAGSHPDMMVVEGDASKASGGISVDQIRAIIPFLAHTPSRSQWRVVIIDSLDEMNINGANAILKTLEEPPEQAVVVMINHQSKPVLPTIRSRAQMLRMTPLGFQETREVITGLFDEADADWVGVAAAMADGAPGKALLFAQSGAVDLYAETTQMLAGASTDRLTIDGLAANWGAGGAKNIVRRQMGQMFMLRLLTMAARQAVGKTDDTARPHLDIEDRAINQICQKHSAAQLADWHQQFQSRFQEAERVNLDVVPIVYDLLERLIGQPRAS